MKRIRAIVMRVGCLCALLAICTAVSALAQEESVRILHVPSQPLERPEYSPEETPQQTAAHGANAFAFQLSAALASDAGDENFICSPYSVWLPLAALTHATDEAYKEELLQALSAAGVEESDLDRAVSRMLYDLTNAQSSALAEEYGQEYAYNPLRIANAIFVSKDLTLQQDFIQAYMDFYRGVSMQVAFESPEAVQVVNHWANEHTEGMIPRIVETFSEDAIAAIANAIYFSDRWRWEFSTDETREGVFHAPQEESIAHFMLREGERLLYYEDERLQAMPLAFKTGGGMLILLPKDGDAVGLLVSITNEFFQEIVRTADERQGKLLLPRFAIESDVMELSDILISLGIPLFDKGTAPLSSLVEEDIPVWISRVSHRAAIQVDEQGTTAAAVTLMEMAGAGIPEPDVAQPFEMICDRPFAFVLYGHTLDGGNQVLFTGVVNQP